MKLNRKAFIFILMLFQNQIRGLTIQLCHCLVKTVLSCVDDGVGLCHPAEREILLRTVGNGRGISESEYKNG